MGNTESNLPPPKDCHEALIRAVKAEDAHGVTTALQHGADPNSKCNYSIYRNNPVLSCAAYNGYTDVVKALLQARNINVNAIGTAYCTALYEAASASNFAMVQLLLSRGADPNLGQSCLGMIISPLETAAGHGCLQSCRLLLEHGANIESTTSAPLVAAIQADHREVCSLLLENRANPNPKTIVSPLAIAAELGHYEICQLLLQYGANVNTVISNPLTEAASKGHVKVCRLLLQHGADICPLCGAPPLVAAAEHGHKEVCRLLLLSGASPDTKDSKGRTAMDIAIDNGHLLLAEWIHKQKQLIKS